MKFKFEHEISSIPELINYITDYKENIGGNLLFRGESKIYGTLDNNTNLIAKLFRPLKMVPLSSGRCKSLINYDTLDSYRHGSQEFYREVDQSDKRIENNFMAYCQHYGIPTPLLDVTTNPLVALYFACISDENEDGILHFFNKDDLVKMPSSYLKHINNDDQRSEDIYPLVNLKRIISSLSEYVLMQKNSSHNNWDRMKEAIISEQIQYSSHFDPTKDSRINFLIKLTTFSDFREDLKSIVYASKETSMKTEYINFLKTIGVIKNNLSEIGNNWAISSTLFNDVYLYVFLIYLSQFFANGSGKFWPSNLFFYVETSANWDRIQAQNGSFLIEIPDITLTSPLLSVKCDEKGSPYSTFRYDRDNILENIPISYTIKVKNKQKIINQLDSLGINEEFLFKDLDHVSKYIKHKYF